MVSFRNRPFRLTRSLNGMCYSCLFCFVLLLLCYPSFTQESAKLTLSNSFWEDMSMHKCLLAFLSALYILTAGPSKSVRKDIADNHLGTPGFYYLKLVVFWLSLKFMEILPQLTHWRMRSVKLFLQNLAFWSCGARRSLPACLEAHNSPFFKSTMPLFENDAELYFKRLW